MMLVSDSVASSVRRFTTVSDVTCHVPIENSLNIFWRNTDWLNFVELNEGVEMLNLFKTAKHYHLILLICTIYFISSKFEF